MMLAVPLIVGLAMTVGRIVIRPVAQLIQIAAWALVPAL
jgi:hypothetical protein